MKLLDGSASGLEAAAGLLRAGGVVAFPTETVYGLGASAFDAAAVARIFEIKRRPSFDPLIVHVVDEAALVGTVAGLSVPEHALVNAFWPGPLTLVTRKNERIPHIVTSGLDTVGVRMPAHPVARELLRRAGLPVAAPSANPFGYLSPTRAEHVVASLGDRIDAVVDAGPSEHGIESTIVALEPEPVLLRHGAIPVEEIEAVAGPLARRTRSETPAAPGQLSQHYSPRTPIRIVERNRVPLVERADAVFLGFKTLEPGYSTSRTLSVRGDLREAAARLFEVLHELDALTRSRIDVELLPPSGLGAAINDRLTRAAAAE